MRFLALVIFFFAIVVEASTPNSLEQQLVLTVKQNLSKIEQQASRQFKMKNFEIFDSSIQCVATSSMTRSEVAVGSCIAYAHGDEENSSAMIAINVYEHSFSQQLRYQIKVLTYEQ